MTNRKLFAWSTLTVLQMQSVCILRFQIITTKHFSLEMFHICAAFYIHTYLHYNYNNLYSNSFNFSTGYAVLVAS